MNPFQYWEANSNIEFSLWINPINCLLYAYGKLKLKNNKKEVHIFN